MPRVSVVMPVYNAAKYVEEAARSVLGQTFGDFELIALNDGSTDKSGDILRRLAAEDGRIRVVERANRGLVAALNEGIGMARGEFIARMDADDVSLPERFAKQVAFLADRRDVAVVGTWIETFGAEASRRWEHPSEPDAAVCALVFRCPLAHPTVTMRRSLFAAEGFAYDAAARHTEDYALWMRVSVKHRLANVPEVLLRYRTHAGQVTAVHAEEQQRRVVELQTGLIRERLGLSVTEAEAALHGKLSFSRLEASVQFVAAADAWLLMLAAANEERPAFPAEPFLRTLVGRYVSVHRFAAANGVMGGDVPRVFSPFIPPGAMG